MFAWVLESVRDGKVVTSLTEESARGLGFLRWSSRVNVSFMGMVNCDQWSHNYVTRA